MKNVEKYKKIFERYGGIMRTKDLQREKVQYRTLQYLIDQGAVEKVRYGYYQWIDPEDFSEVITVSRLFPDAVFCMETALRYYGYSDRTPTEWHLAVSKNSGKSRFKIDYPFVKPYYVDPACLEVGLTSGTIAFMIKSVCFAIACGTATRWTKKFSTKRFSDILPNRKKASHIYWNMPKCCGSKRL